MPHQVYEQPVRIHFGDCDPAGIVYHPSYYKILNELHEDFLREVAQAGFIELARYGVDFPAAGIRTDFIAPSRPGELLEGRVWIEKIGTASVRFAITLSKGGELRVKCCETMCCVDKGPDGKFRKHPIPEPILEAFAPYVIELGDPLLEFRS